MMRLAHGKLGRVLYGNNNLGSVPPPNILGFMDHLDDICMQSFGLDNEDEGRRFMDFAGQYRKAWDGKYKPRVLKLVQRYFQEEKLEEVPWEQSEMKKRLDIELTWRAGYTNDGSPLAHNIPLLCDLLIKVCANTLKQYPTSIGEVSCYIQTLPSSCSPRHYVPTILSL
jgi:hypothetical protein